MFSFITASEVGGDDRDLSRIIHLSSRRVEFPLEWPAESTGDQFTVDQPIGVAKDKPLCNGEAKDVLEPKQQQAPQVLNAPEPSAGAIALNPNASEFVPKSAPTVSAPTVSVADPALDLSIKGTNVVGIPAQPAPGPEAMRHSHVQASPRANHLVNGAAPKSNRMMHPTQLMEPHQMMEPHQPMMIPRLPQFSESNSSSYMPGIANMAAISSYPDTPQYNQYSMGHVPYDTQPPRPHMGIRSTHRSTQEYLAYASPGSNDGYNNVTRIGGLQAPPHSIVASHPMQPTYMNVTSVHPNISVSEPHPALNVGSTTSQQQQVNVVSTTSQPKPVRIMTRGKQPESRSPDLSFSQPRSEQSAPAVCSSAPVATTENAGKTRDSGDSMSGDTGAMVLQFGDIGPFKISENRSVQLPDTAQSSKVKSKSTKAAPPPPVAPVKAVDAAQMADRVKREQVNSLPATTYPPTDSNSAHLATSPTPVTVPPHVGSTSTVTSQTGPTPSVAPQTGPTSTVAPQPASTSTVAPQTGPTSTVAPQTGPTSTAAPQTGPTSTVAPQAGPTSTVAPQAGPTSTVAPQSGPSSTVAPQAGPTSTVAPQTGPISTVAPQTGPTSTVAPQTGPTKQAPSHTNGMAQSPPAALSSKSPLPAPDASLSAAAHPVSTPPGQHPSVTQVSPPAPKSWANLFSSSSSPANAKPAKTPSVAEKEAVPPTVSNGSSDDIGAILSEMELKQAAIPLQARRLINQANWCYINATLQALLACPPFYHVLKALPTFPPLSNKQSSTPVLDAMVEFVNEFTEIKQEKQSNKKRRELKRGDAFEPKSVYNVLSVMKTSDSMFTRGKQEDAEEFLTCLLNKLNEEVAEAIKQYEKKSKPADAVMNGHEPGLSDPEEDGQDWERVGPKNKSVVTHSNVDKMTTPILQIFGGQLRSSLHTGSNNPESVTLEPFFTVPLNVQANKTVEEALHAFVSKESIDDYTCPQTKQELDAHRKLTFEHLPPILILHLKCFVYDKHGGSQKVLHNMSFSENLSFEKELLSKKHVPKDHKSYKLFAVVYHSGTKTTGGHYHTDVFHAGMRSWVRFDDNSTTQISHSDVYNFKHPCVPYLLYYRRADTQLPTPAVHKHGATSSN